MTTELNEQYPWERRQDEVVKAFMAFCAYRDLGPARSLDKAYRATKGTRTGNAPGRWREWSGKFDWLNRAREYDLYRELLARADREAEHQKELSEFRERQRTLAISTMRASLELLRLANEKLASMANAYQAWQTKVAAATTDEERQALQKEDPINPVSLPGWLRAAAAVAQVASDAEAQALAVNELLHILENTKKPVHD